MNTSNYPSDDFKNNEFSSRWKWWLMMIGIKMRYNATEWQCVQTSMEIAERNDSIYLVYIEEQRAENDPDYISTLLKLHLL